MTYDAIYLQAGDCGSPLCPHTPGGGSPDMPNPLTPTSYDCQWRERKGTQFVVITVNCVIGMGTLLSNHVAKGKLQ